MRRLVVSAAAVVAVLLPGVASAAPSPLQNDVNQAQAAGVSSVAAEVNTNGTVTDAVAGVSQLGTTNPVSAGTHYRTGSVTKTFVAATILQLVGEGKLSLDDPVARWLPGVITGNGNDGTRITVRQLLNHTSGLFDYTADSRFLATVDTPAHFYATNTAHYDPATLISYAVSHPPNFAPGTAFSYSNTNYIVVGEIIRAVTGNTWDVEVTNRIVRPLGLTNTSIPGDTTTLPAPFSHGYNLWSPGVYSDTTVDNMTWGGSAGSIITTTRDEVTFYSALLSGKVLAPAQLKQMQTTVALSSKSAYGLGIGVIKLCNVSVWTHTGGVIGYETIVATTPNGATTLALSESTTDLFASDPTFDGHATAASDVLLRHVFCGPNTTSTDSYTQETALMHGNPAAP